MLTESKNKYLNIDVIKKSLYQNIAYKLSLLFEITLPNIVKNNIW